MDFIFGIKTHFFPKGTSWINLDKIRYASWFLSVDIEDDEKVPCYDAENELRISEGISFKSVQIFTKNTQETHPYWEAMLDMSYLDSAELRDVIFKDLPEMNGIYRLNIYFDEEDLNFSDNFIKICEPVIHKHRWEDGWVCSKCGIRKADWVEFDKDKYKKYFRLRRKG